MFIRRLKVKEGTVYIQVVDKSSRKYRVLKSFGKARSCSEIKILEKQARQWIDNYLGVQEIDFSNTNEMVELFFDSISSLKRVGFDCLLGSIFDEIGFNKITDTLFRELVIARISYPCSKLKTTEYLYRYKHVNWHENQLYRYLDKLYNTQKELIQQISYEHTLKILSGDISVVFYDVTTLYFEADREDDLRKTGFSKEGKHQNPQIVLGLLVSKNGYPLAYEIFEGNKFEGYTMLPVIDKFKQQFHLKNLIIIADAGLMSTDNVKDLQAGNYEFILGARIKNEKQVIKDKIFNLRLKDGESKIINKGNLKLIIHFSEKRAKKDQHNRERGLKKLEKQIKSGRLTKSSINNRGYNKFLEMEGEVTLKINQTKIQDDSKWDGLKGYLTNTQINNEEVLENYNQLWHIEKAFRIAKTDIKVRPIYHRLSRRIEAHICISFVAYKVYKELERKLYEKKATISVTNAIEIAENIIEIEIMLPQNGKIKRKTLLLTDEQRYLASLFQFGC